MGAFDKYSNGSYSPLPDSAPFTIIYPQSNGVSDTSRSGSDPYGGTPIKITSGNSASGLSSTPASMSSDYSALYDLIMKNTDKNNEWSAAQAQKQMDFQERMNSIAMEFNASEAAKNRDWQEMMSNTAHQREIADLKAAGLNPVLSASGGNGAAVTSGATASGVTSAGSKADPDQSANSAMASIYSALINAQTQMYNANLSAKTNLAMAEKQVEASMYGAQLAANANMYGSQMAYNASTYNADMSYKNNEAQRQWNADHPSNLVSAGSSLFGKEGVSGAKGILSTLADKLNLKGFGNYLIGRGA